MEPMRPGTKKPWPWRKYSADASEAESKDARSNGRNIAVLETIRRFGGNALEGS